MLYLFDRTRDRMLGEYIIGPVICADLGRLLAVIAPMESDAALVIGVGGEGGQQDCKLTETSKRPLRSTRLRFRDVSRDEAKAWATTS